MKISTEGDILFIQPPFAGIDRPSLGLHILQSLGATRSLTSHVYYANIHLAEFLRKIDYLDIVYSPPLDLLGEEIFARLVFPEWKAKPVVSNSHCASRKRQATTKSYSLDSFIEPTRKWLVEVESLIRDTNYRVYALSSMFAQNCASAALANLVRKAHPKALIIVGGANCEGAMAHGVAALTDAFNVVFSGEGESTFASFCDDLVQGREAFPRFIFGSPTQDLDGIPCPDYDDFFGQLETLLPQSGLNLRSQIALPYETSRGCWWGQKRHCTFCGLNANGMAFRLKKPEKVLSELQALTSKYSVNKVAMTDNIMPLQYFDTLLPMLERSGCELDIFFEQKANLKWNQLAQLKRAGVSSIQPGIEAFSSDLLSLMRKGVKASQNIRLLKWCRSLGITVVWNLLYGFPNEQRRFYGETLDLLPVLSHLHPPNGFGKVSLDRFSPYFSDPSQFGIQSLVPHDSYYRVYPSNLPIPQLAYHFVGECDTVVPADSPILGKIRKEVDAWIDSWRSLPLPPILAVVDFEPGYFLVIDSRPIAVSAIELIDVECACLLVGETSCDSEDARLAVTKRWMLYLDGIFLGLATYHGTSPEVLSAMSGGQGIASIVPGTKTAVMSVKAEIGQG